MKITRFLMRHECTTRAPRVRHECTTNAPRAHRECTTSAPRVHHDGTTSAPRAHHECTTMAPRVRQECTTSPPRVLMPHPLYICGLLGARVSFIIVGKVLSILEISLLNRVQKGIRSTYFCRFLMNLSKKMLKIVKNC